MMPIDLRTFLAGLAKSRLLRNDQLVEFQGQLHETEHDDDPNALAQSLVRRGWLTRWQSEQLLSGHTRFYLGKYKLLDLIGHGGMGAVFKAQHTVMDRTVALKMMAKALLDKPRAVARFHREVKAAAALNHPHIVTAFDADCVGEAHFLVMEYVEGRDLGYWLKRRGRLPVHVACEFIRQAALGLEHAHQHGMVHRDIKPSNLLIAQRQREDQPVVKILDMGLARFVSEINE